MEKNNTFLKKKVEILRCLADYGEAECEYTTAETMETEGLITNVTYSNGILYADIVWDNEYLFDDIPYSEPTLEERIATLEKQVSILSKELAMTMVLLNNKENFEKNAKKKRFSRNFSKVMDIY